ncbi:MAG TPA: hypothetical protein VKA43_07720 [Gammaproteobacteria bacterium]|nr:hypothetical protein [Gammaproteobacteria bacterium]
MLRDLALSYLEFTVLTGTSVFVQFLMLTTWGRIADVYGNRLILILASISLPFVPAIWLSAAALVMRVTGLNSMVGFVYDFIGRPPPELEERAPAPEKRDNDGAPAKPERNGDE